jgi:hypothetical protein
MRERARPAWPVRRSRRPHSREGGAVPLILLLLLALTGLGHAAFLVALEEEAASTASVAVLQARLMAEGGVRRALRDAPDDSLPGWLGREVEIASHSTAEGSSVVSMRPLSREIHWVEGAGAAALSRDGPRRVRERVSRLLWALSPIERLGAVRGVVEHGGSLVAPDGAIDTRGVAASGDHESPVGCLDLREELDSAAAGGWLSEGSPVSAPPAGHLPALGLLEHDSLLARVPARALGSVTPAPLAEGARCLVESPGNWGSPTTPEGPCGGHRTALAAEGDLTVAGGEGQGLLLVTGNLRLTSGARFAGLLVVGGDLALDGAAELQGLARVAGSVRVQGGARVLGAYCPALLALRGIPALRRPLDLPGGGWIRPL